MDTVQLVARCQAGDELAVERLVTDYQPPLFRLALSILDDGRAGSVAASTAAEAEEVIQDVFLTALHKLDSYRGEASLSTWLYAITINLCRNRLRARRRRERLQQLFQSLQLAKAVAADAEAIVIQHEADSSLARRIQALDEKYRLPIVLRYYHDCPVEEIAHLLNVPPGTIHSRLNKARQLLRDQITAAAEGYTDIV